MFLLEKGLQLPSRQPLLGSDPALQRFKCKQHHMVTPKHQPLSCTPFMHAPVLQQQVLNWGGTDRTISARRETTVH